MPSAIPSFIMNRNEIFTLAASMFSLMLVNCSQPLLANRDYTNPDSTGDGAPKMELSQPMAADGLHTAEEPTLGKIMHVDASMFTVGPGVCESGILGTDCSNETDTEVAFQALSVECDDDSCDVNEITNGDAAHSTTIAITPKAAIVTLHVTGVSGENIATGDLAVFPNTLRESSSFDKAK